MKMVLMWTINDFPAYEMVSSWSTHAKLASSYYIKNNKAFMLTNDGKMFFYCHRQLLLTDHKYRKNINDFFVGRVKRDVALVLPW
jgi:hypothetical protein